MNQEKQKEIAVGMSGGVDSSVTAYLLQKEGYDIMGITFSFFDYGSGEDNQKCAKAVADVLNIPHYSADLSQPFHDRVIVPFIDTYCQGETPNPCVVCNRTMKFGPEALSATSAQGFATGHYAKVEKDTGSGRYLLKKGIYPEKDQSYFLAGLSQEQLAVAHFPLGIYKKDQIREIAREANLPTATRSDSQDICFIPDGDYEAFIHRNRPQVKTAHPVGNFVDVHGNILGQHKGIISYTIGQRRGLGISSSGRLYVGAIRPQDNTVVLCSDEELFSQRLTAHSMNLVAATSLQQEIRCYAKVRSRQKAVPARAIQVGENRFQVEFDEPQRAVCPGQGVVLYDGDTVLAGGMIENQ